MTTTDRFFFFASAYLRAYGLRIFGNAIMAAMLLLSVPYNDPIFANEYPEILQSDQPASHENSESARAQAEQRIAIDMRFLASDELRGRGPGTVGLDRAADYIAQRWESLGLETRLFDGSPFQTFNIPGSIAAANAQTNRLRLYRNAAQGNETVAPEPPLELDQDFRPLSLGGSNQFDAPLVFVGYGITAKEPGLSYDDYAGIDVRGKGVVMLRKEPQQSDPQSPFAGTRSSVHAYFNTKYANAVAHGAVAVLFMNDAVSLEGSTTERSKDILPGVEDAGKSNNAAATIPALFVRREAMEPWCRRSIGKSLIELEQAIDTDLKPRSVEMIGVQVQGAVDLKNQAIQVKNVICRVPGVGAMASETVVVGAHYDHVGMGGAGSLAPGTIAIHNGADDNASGTAALLEISQKMIGLLANDTQPRRQIVLIAFTGEERGLLGSRYYVNHPRFALDSTVTMINMDMVGRMADRQLIVYGAATSPRFPEIIDRANVTTGFRIRKQSEGYGPSDHQPFYERQIPVLHLFTGLHSDYHRPTDDFEKINTDGIAAITDMVYQMTVELAKSPGKPSYVAVQGRADIRLPVERRARLGVRLKSMASEIPQSSKEIVQIESVAADSPASRASLAASDILLAIDGTSIDSTKSLIDMLAGKSSGDTVTLEVQRGTERLTISVQLGQ